MVPGLLLLLLLLLLLCSQDFLNNVCTNIIHMHKKQLQYYSGNYDQYVQTRAELEENQMKKYKWEQDQISHMKVGAAAGLRLAASADGQCAILWQGSTLLCTCQHRCAMIVQPGAGEHRHVCCSCPPDCVAAVLV